MFRVVHGLFHFSNDVFVHQHTLRTTQSSNYHTFVNSFVPRTIRYWNTLPSSVTTSVYLLHVAPGHIFINTLLLLCPLYMHMHICTNYYRKKTPSCSPHNGQTTILSFAQTTACN